MSDVGSPVSGPVSGGLRRLARHTFVYAVADLIAKGGAYLLIPLLTRGLTKDGFGTYTLVVSIVPVLTIIGSLGLGGAVTRLWFDLDAKSRPRFQMAAFLAMQTTSLGVALLLTLAGPSLFGSVFTGVHGSLFTFGVWASFFLTSTTVPLAVLRAEERPKQFAILSSAQFLGPAVGVVIGVASGGGVHAVLWGHVIGAAFVMLLSLGFLIPLVSGPPMWSMVRPALALGIPVVPHLIAHWALNVADRVAIERSLGAAMVGFYAVGYQIAQGVSLVATALNNATVPTFYRAAQRDRRELLGRAWAPLQYGIGIFSLGIAVFGREAVQLLAAPSYVGSAAFIPWVALGYWLLAAYYFPVNALFYSKRVRMIPVATLIAAGLNYGLNVWLLPHRGLIAAAQNTAIAYGTLFALVMLAAQRTYKLPYRFGKAAMVAALGVCVYWLSTLAPVGVTGTLIKVPIFLLYVAFGFLIVASDVRVLRAFRGDGGAEPGDAAAAPTVVLAAATASQARSMAACGDALRRAGLTPMFVSLDPIIGKSASAGFRDAGVDFREHAFRKHAAGGGARILLRGRGAAESLITGTRAVVLGNDFSPFERLVIDAARSAGCVSVLLQDGVIALTGTQAGGGGRSGSVSVTVAKRALSMLGMPFDPRPYGMGGCDIVCVYGESTAAALRARGVPDSSVLVTGQPRYDAITGSTGDSAGFVLVTTQPFSRYGLATLDHETATFAAMIDAAIAENRPVVVKLHPDTDAISRDALTQRFHDRVQFEQDQAIEQLYRSTAALITLSSTTALEAMIFQIPVVVAEVPGFPTTLPYLGSGAVFEARSLAEIAPALHEALHRPKTPSRAATEFLAAHLAGLDGHAADRVAAAIASAVKGRAEAHPVAEPLG